MDKDFENYSFEKTDVKFKTLDNKLIKDGKTAILTNSKWGLNIDMFRFDPVIINLILDKKKSKSSLCGDNDEVKIFNDNINKQIINYCNAKYNFVIFKHEYFWPNCLKLHWVPVGTFFRIAHCGDNGEYIITIQENLWTKA